MSGNDIQRDAARLLAEIPIFRHLNDEELYEIVRLLRPVQFGANEVVFKQGEKGSHALVIETGEIEIRLESTGRQEVLVTLGRHDVLGELSLVDPSPRSATAITLTPTTGYEIHHSDFDYLLSTLNSAAYKVIRQVSVIITRRIRGVNLRLESYRAPEKERERLLADGRLSSGRYSVAGGSSDQKGVGDSGVQAKAVIQSFTGRLKRVATRFWSSANDGE